MLMWSSGMDVGISDDILADGGAAIIKVGWLCIYYPGEGAR